MPSPRSTYGPTGVTLAAGTPVTLRATVLPAAPGMGVPTGGVVIGVVPVTNGTAEFTYVPSAIGGTECVNAAEDFKQMVEEGLQQPPQLAMLRKDHPAALPPKPRTAS